MLPFDTSLRGVGAPVTIIIYNLSKNATSNNIYLKAKIFDLNIDSLVLMRLFFVIDGSFDESEEERMSLVRATLEFRVCLCADKPWMVGQFNHFHDVSVR